jgi:predicted GIY-YIG superfamily endonuclease
MQSYLYFLRVDRNTIKYGITNRLSKRLNEHYKDFINGLKLDDNLHIVRIIQITDIKILRKIESRLTDILSYTKDCVKKYNHIELFSSKHLDKYINLIIHIIDNACYEFQIDTPIYNILSDDDIHLVCNNIKNFKYIINSDIKDIENNYIENTNDNENIIEKNIIDENTIKENKLFKNDVKKKIKDNKSLKNKKICLRCGISVSKLKRHLQCKTQCEVKYLDIDCTEMIKNYDKYYNEYTVKKINNIHYCVCGKEYKHSSGLSRHKVQCDSINNKIKNEIDDQTDNTMNTMNTIQNDINLHLQYYGYEIMPDINIVLKIILEEEEARIKEDRIYLEITLLLFKLLHIDTIENRNIYVGSKSDGIFNVFKTGSGWIKEYRRNMVQDFPLLVKKQILQMLNYIKQKYIYNKEKVDLMNTAIERVEHYYNHNSLKIIMNNFMLVLLNNNEKVLETKKASLKATNIVSSTSLLEDI